MIHLGLRKWLVLLMIALGGCSSGPQLLKCSEGNTLIDGKMVHWTYYSKACNAGK